MESIHIQTCRQTHLHEVRQWLSEHDNWVLPGVTVSLGEMLRDDCLLLARSGKAMSPSSHGKLLGVVGLNLEAGAIQLLALNQTSALPRLISALERVAICYGMLSLKLQIKPSARQAWTLPFYHPDPDTPAGLQRNLRRRLTRHARKALQLNQQLGVPANYGCNHRLRLQQEPRQFASIGMDVFGREQFMLPKAAHALLELMRSAAASGHAILPVSAFRSVEYQAELLRNKLQKGLSIKEILRVSAAPGYSEHHSGRAVDLTTLGAQPLEEVFADTEAFAWLNRHAAAFGFRLSYPRGNRHGVTFEPWHWYFKGQNTNQQAESG